jgi:hypothetical protein
VKRDLNEWSDNRTVNLNPANWQSGRPKPHEPFWGHGWPTLLIVVLKITVAVIAIHYFR